MQLEYSVFFMPRCTIVCKEVFDQEGVSGDVVLGEYALDFIPIDSDVLSLEMDAALKVHRTLQAQHTKLWLQTQ